MPTPVPAARQCLSPTAVTALDAAVASARRRAHAQTTSLHLISALLAPQTAPPLLRDALARARSAAYSPRIQLKALDLCFAVSLDRLPSTPSSPPNFHGSASWTEPARARRGPALRARLGQNFFRAEPCSGRAAKARAEPKSSVLSVQPEAPLSLSLHQQQHHLGLSSQQHQQQQQEAPVAAWMMQQSEQNDPAPHAHGGYVHGAPWHLRSSRFLHPAQQLLQGFCSLPVDSTAKRAKPPPPPQKQEVGAGGGEGSSSSTSGWPPSAQIQAMDALELQRLKDKLYVMLEEVDRRYRRYCEQMRGLAGGFEAVAGERAAAGYTALAAQTISKHFRSLRDGIVAQLQAVRKALGEKDVSAPGMTRGDTPRLKVLDQCIRQQKAMHQNGGFMESHPWRPQRGLPERAVTILRAWLFEHFLHPYPSDVDKHILARQTGLSRSQVSNWFINARVRLWKPMVEEMYVEEMKADQDGDGVQAGGINPNNPSSSSSHASDGQQQQQQRVVADEGDRLGGGGDRKPTRAQLHVVHDAGSLASVVNIAGADAARMESFGVMGAHHQHHLDFDAYDGQGQGFGGAGGGVSLTLGLQQHDTHGGGGGVNIAFGAPSAQHGFLYPGEQMDAVHSAAGHGHHIQFGAGAAETSHGGQDQHYRDLSAGFHLLRDLAG